MEKIIFVTILFLSTNFSFAQTQLEMNVQEHKKYLKSDKELNSIYQKILKAYKSDTAFIKNLKASQKIWVQFRDAEMKMKYPDREPGQYGSVQPMCWSMYLTQLTEERITTLKQWLDGIEEGDVCAGSTKIKTN
jgi:uncharacterized protein YecT (DUF1311 family)